MTGSEGSIAPHYSSTSRASGTRAIWQFRRLLFSLVARDLKVKYQRSVLGLLWTLLNPMMLVLVYVMVFTMLRIGVDNFWAFLISGIFAFQFVSGSLNRSASVLRNQAALTRAVAFPSEILILGPLFALLVEFLIEITIVVLVLCVFYHRGVPATVVLFPFLILLQVLMTAGLMFAMSVFSVLHNDVEHALPAVTRLWFYLSPIFYPVALVPEQALPFYYMNPMVGLLRLHRLVLYEGVWPSWTLLGLVSATAVGVLVLGYWTFQRFKDVCVEIA